MIFAFENLAFIKFFVGIYNMYNSPSFEVNVFVLSPLPLLSHQLDNKTKKELDDHRRVRCMHGWHLLSGYTCIIALLLTCILALSVYSLFWVPGCRSLYNWHTVEHLFEKMIWYISIKVKKMKYADCKSWISNFFTCKIIVKWVQLSNRIKKIIL